MPDRVKCLHVLAGQSLAQGRGVNPLGDEVLDALGAWWEAGPCVVPMTERAPVAAIDCGTNTVKLLIGDLPSAGPRDADGPARRGVDATGRLADDAL